MTAIRVFVNEKPVDVTSPATVADAVTALDGALGAQVLNGSARATDARGIDVEPGDAVTAGSILRVISVRPGVQASRPPAAQEL